MSDFLTTIEVARELKISTSTAQRMARDGVLIALKVGKLWRFPKQTVEIHLYKLQQRARWNKEKEGGALRPRNGLKEFLKLARPIGLIDTRG